jgi:hypothetical protein
LGLEKTGLQVDNILAELVIFSYQGLDLIFEWLDILDLFLEFADVGLLALAEGAL